MSEPLVDLTGLIYPGMWSYPHPYPPFRMSELRHIAPDGTVTRSHMLEMSELTGTYLETPAHIESAASGIDGLPLSLLIRPAVVLNIPAAGGQPVGAAEVLAELRRSRLQISPGDALLVGTGWESRWTHPEFVSGGPWFGSDVVDLVRAHGVGLIGSDMARFDEPNGPSLVIPGLLRLGVLILAPLTGLTALGSCRGRLIALPLRIAGATAAPCRAVFEPDKD